MLQTKYCDEQTAPQQALPASRFHVLNSFGLHLIAMGLMLLDHMWGTVVPGNLWMTNLGRLSFPIFAFLLSEGFRHTHNLKAYTFRLTFAAIISELPFNLMMGGYWIDPFHQNVIWTFLIALGCMTLTERCRRRIGRWYPVPGVGVFLLGALLANITFTDYAGCGVLTVGAFYFFHEDRLLCQLLQAASMVLIHGVLFKGMYIDITLFGLCAEIPQQGLAVLALLPIWLYNGEKGPGGTGYRIFCYLFYPVHILVLSLIALMM